MPSADGPRGPDDDQPDQQPPSPTVEFQLFESLVHHLVEKGVLTKNDALSVVQTVAEVNQGRLWARRSPDGAVHNGLAVLERLYSSFELLSERPHDSPLGDTGNVHQLRPPIHGNNPSFPIDD